MIKKSLWIFATLGATAQLASAQVTTTTVDSVYTETRSEDKYRVVTNRFGSNWEIGFGVGGNILFGDHDKQAKLLDRVGVNFGVHAAKWFTPGVAVRIGAFGGELKGLSAWTGHSNTNPTVNYGNYQGFIRSNNNVYTTSPYTYYKTSQRYVNGHADVLLNLSNMICGYKENRFYSFIPYASVGFGVSLNKSITNEYSHEVTAGFGLLNRFRLSEALNLDVDVRGTLVSDRFDQEYAAYSAEKGNFIAQAGRWGEGILTASVGLSYRIPRRGWDNVVERTVRVNDNVLADLRNRVSGLTNENEDLRRQLESALNREVTRENVAAQPLLVTFPIDRWTLSNKDRVNLGFLAETIKANPNTVFSVTGYADQGTGSVKRNIFLARKRSEVIFDCLVNEFGVSESQLRRDDKGGVENMFYNDPRCSRAVLLKVAE